MMKVVTIFHVNDDEMIRLMTIMMSCLSKIRERLTETPRRCGKPPYNGTSADHCSRPLVLLITLADLTV